MIWRKDMRLGREKEEDSASKSVRQEALEKEERWEKTARKLQA